MKIKSLIRATEAAIAAENDPKKLRDLQAKLAMFVTTRAEMDDDGDEDDDDKKDPDDDGDDSAAEKHAKRAAKLKAKAKATEHRSKAAEHKQKAAEAEEAAKKCEEEGGGEEEERSEEARIGLSEGARAAIASQNEVTREQSARLDKLEREATARAQQTMIDAALVKRRITRHEAKTLATKSMAFVTDFLEMRPKAIIAIGDDDLLVPSADPNTGDALPRDVEIAINQAMATHADKPAKERAEIREELVRAQTKRLNGAATANGRY